MSWCNTVKSAYVSSGWDSAGIVLQSLGRRIICRMGKTLALLGFSYHFLERPASQGHRAHDRVDWEWNFGLSFFLMLNSVSKKGSHKKFNSKLLCKMLLTWDSRLRRGHISLFHTFFWFYFCLPNHKYSMLRELCSLKRYVHIFYFNLLITTVFFVSFLLHCRTVLTNCISTHNDIYPCHSAPITYSVISEAQREVACFTLSSRSLTFSKECSFAGFNFIIDKRAVGGEL